MIALLVMTDGRRDCLVRAMDSAENNLIGDIGDRFIHDDSGDRNHRVWLRNTYPQFELISNGFRNGFGGAIRQAWRYIQDYSDAAHVFHLEDDFLFNRPVEVDAMAAVLDTRPHLAQMALRRQAWNAAEIAAGGIVEQHPCDYTQVDYGGRSWLEHRRFFTTNPSLYRRSLTGVEWPHGAHSEGVFTHRLLERGTPEVPGDQVRFAFWGARDSGDAVEHIGAVRVGAGY